MLRDGDVRETEPTIALSADVIARRIGHAAVLIQLGTNRIYELNRTGARLWELIGEGRSRKQIHDMMLREFDVDTTQLTAAIDELLSLLAAEGLVSVQHDN